MPSARLDGLQAITLDLYGTLLDVESSVLGAFTRFLAAKGCPDAPGDVVRSWESAYFQETMIDTLLGQGRTSFERISRRALGQVLTRQGITHGSEEIEELLASRDLGGLYPDVREGLLALKPRYTLVLLSNGDRTSLERAVANLSIPVDQIVSAEQAGVYKPHPGVYRAAIEQLALEPSQVLQVAAHAWDIRGAQAFGMAGAYVNRREIPNGDDRFQPDLEVSDLRNLAGRLH